MIKTIYINDSSKRAQHDAVRNNVGWYYFTHYLVEVSGKDATAFLDYIYPNNISTLKIGSDRYTPMLNEKGIIIDDVVVMRIEENKYWISTLYYRKLLPWFDAHKGSYEIAYADITASYDMYAVQGPKSKDFMNTILEKSVDEQKFFTIRDNKIDGVPVKINRAGFSGEKVGYEIYIAPDKREFLEAILNKQGKAFNAMQVTEFQIMLLTLPSERGFYLMTDLWGTNPFEVGFEKGINWDKEFIGKEALLQIKADGPKRKLVGFTIDDDRVLVEARNYGSAGAAIIKDGWEVGRVTKFTYGYTANKSIGFALVSEDQAVDGNTVTIEGHPAVITKERVFA